jgi:hypothetical protein
MTRPMPNASIHFSIIGRCLVLSEKKQGKDLRADKMIGTMQWISVLVQVQAKAKIDAGTSILPMQGPTRRASGRAIPEGEAAVRAR